VDRKRPRWIELRTARGKLACKYDPERHLIEYVHRGKKTLFDLAELQNRKKTQLLAREADL